MGASRIEKPRLAQQLDQLEKTLSGCHELANNIERVADRILGTEPQGVSETAGKPPVDTIERRFADAIGYAEALHQRLMHASQRLNSAV